MNSLVCTVSSGGTGAIPTGTSTVAATTTGDAVTDGTNTTIIGPETEPNSTTVFRAMWAQTLL